MNNTTKNRIKQGVLQAIPLVFLFFGMFGAFKIFEFKNEEGLQKQNEAYLIECTNNLQKRLDRDIQNYSDTIKSISYLYSELINNIADGVQVLKEIEKKTQFDDLYFVGKDSGKIYSSAGEVIAINGNDIDATESEYYEDAMSGHFGIGALYPSQITGKRVVGFYAPVISNERVLGVLVGCIREETIREALATYFYGTLSDTVLIDENLKIIGVTSRLSLYDYIDEDDDPYDFRSVVKIQLSDALTEKTVFNALRSHESAPFKYDSPIGVSLGYIKKLESLDWMIIQTFPADAIMALNASANHAGKILECILIFLFTLYILHLISSDLRKRKLIQKKLNEQTLMALIDELTDVYNRRAFEEDVDNYKNTGVPENLTLIEFDINGLKTANDTLGHKAGDELITATAQCLKISFSNIGKIYRLGGDEFAVFMIASRNDVNCAVANFRNNVSNWKGKYNSELAVSLGIAQMNTYKDKSIDEIKTIADMLMYEDKDLYYKVSGKDRRSH